MTRKPFRQSGLRKSINVEDATDDNKSAAAPAARVEAEDEEDEGNVVVRPAISRAGSKKKRKPASRLSFGVRADDEEDGADAGGPDVATAKKKSEGSGLKKVISLKDLAMRSREDDDRPRYSKEYLDELQSSTPNTPRPPSHSDVPPEAEDEMSLDASELEGAVIVEDPSSAPAAPSSTSAPRILTASEIQEKKDRRARRAHEDFISLSDEDEEDASARRKKKDDGRLARDDENIYEGFEEFVEDGDVALGRRAEREARRRKRAEMASLIAEAEGNSDEESDESEAERRAAFEAAQSRAGMDGLKRPTRDPGEPAPKPRLTPLPTMAECLRSLQETLAAKKAELEARSRKVAELRVEREEIRNREAEVQRLVDEAGEKYKAAVAGAGGNVGALESAESPAVRVPANGSAEFAAERGLESFGTPTVQTDAEDGLAG